MITPYQTRGSSDPQKIKMPIITTGSLAASLQHIHSPLTQLPLAQIIQVDEGQQMLSAHIAVILGANPNAHLCITADPQQPAIATGDVTSAEMSV